MKIVKYLRFLLWPVALLLSGWMLAQLPLASLPQTIAALSGWQWLAWLVINGLIIWLATQRWWLLMAMLNARVAFVKLMCIRQAGQAISFITPGPQFGGEPLQLFWLCRGGVALQKALLALGLDRFFEVWINLSILVLGVLLLLFSPAGSLAANYQMLALLMLLLLLLAVIARVLLHQPEWLSARFERLAQRWAEHPHLSKINHHWQALGADLLFTVKTQKPQLLLAVILSLAGWLALLGELALLLHCVNVSLDVAGFAMLLVAMRLALLLPIPGGIGTLEASVFWSFQLLGLPASAALGLIALMRLRDAAILIAGLICLRQLGPEREGQLLANKCET